MLSSISICNFKSISQVKLNLGRVTVLIGENGSGKSNILEAIGFAAAALADKLEDEFLANRGIRITSPEFTSNQFEGGDRPGQIQIELQAEGQVITAPFTLNVDYEVSEEKEGWSSSFFSQGTHLDYVDFAIDKQTVAGTPLLNRFLEHKQDALAAWRSVMESGLADYLIYAPENTVLRNFEHQGSIKPLGPKGEGLLKLLLQASEQKNTPFLEELNHHLALLGWFKGLPPPTEEDEFRGRLRIVDKWLPAKSKLLDQRSANEGFLYLLFFFTLMLAPRTPRCFAIDNLDASLNPRLSSALMARLACLAKERGKQIILTTHNPAVLDGMDLGDNDQMLYVVRRDSEGRTVVNRAKPPRPRPDGKPMMLSSAFMAGYLGGLPDHF